MKSAGVVFRSDGEFLFTFAHQDPTTGASAVFPVHSGWVIALFDPSGLSEAEMTALLSYPSLDQLVAVVGEHNIFISELAFNPEPGWAYFYAPGRGTLARVRVEDVGNGTPEPVSGAFVEPSQLSEITWRGRRSW